MRVKSHNADVVFWIFYKGLKSNTFNLTSSGLARGVTGKLEHIGKTDKLLLSFKVGVFFSVPVHRMWMSLPIKKNSPKIQGVKTLVTLFKV